MLRWPDAATVRAAVERWAQRIAAAHHDVVAVGWFGSYPAGTWGVGSDVDLVILLRDSRERFDRRPLRFQADDLPVPADLLVYTPAEWARLAQALASRDLAAGVEWLVGQPSSLG